MYVIVCVCVHFQSTMLSIYQKVVFYICLMPPPNSVNPMKNTKIHLSTIVSSKDHTINPYERFMVGPWYKPRDRIRGVVTFGKIYWLIG